jgi:hypothetical protein
MAAKNKNGSRSDAGVTIQLHLLGIIVFSASLVLASALATYGFVRVHDNAGGGRNSSKPHLATNFIGTVEIETTNVPAWGQLTVRDIDLEQPEEYVAYETGTNDVETWTFEGMNPDAVRTVMQSSGLLEEQIEKALSPACLTYTNTNTVITPDNDLVFSLSPDARARLYAVLRRFSSNGMMQYPFIFPANTFDTRVDKSGMSDETLALLQKALYSRGDGQCFSDLEALLHSIPDDAERMQTVKALSHQSAVLLGIRVWPDSDVDKIINYWSWPAGIHIVDVRPFLDSLKREPNGGAASILYFLPPFARARLYTYPLPSQPGDPTMDCHWTTMNFFNETPDDRFSNPKYTVNYLLTHYYKIGKPTVYGDLVFLLNKNGDAIHSAVYLADDIVFTKNGNNFAQPWMLMHLKDLLAEYSVDGPPDVIFYRNRDW